MAEEYPSNSKKGKPPVERVTVNEVHVREKSVFRRVGDSFRGDSARSVLDMVIFDVIIPTTKSLFVDAATQGLERAILGTTNGRRSSSGRSSGSGSNYERYTVARGSQSNRQESRPSERRGPASMGRFDLGEFVFATRIDAEEVLDTLTEQIERYDHTTVADLYAAVNQTGPFTNASWGWYSLRDAAIRRARDGYILILPEPEPIR